MDPIETAKAYRRRDAREAERVERYESLRRQAGEVAAALVEAFGPRVRVHLFGSLLDLDRFRGDSDIDLAVEGLQPAEYREGWRVVDSLPGQAARRLRLFLARLERDRETAATVHGRLHQALDRVRGTPADPVTVAAVALYLQNLYTALEELLRRVAAELDGSVPAGDDWHRELLGQMTLDIAGVRPRLIGDRLHADLDLLRRFRDVVRYAYAAEDDWAGMQSAVEAAERAMEALPDSLARLQETVRAAIRECERGG